MKKIWIFLIPPTLLFVVSFLFPFIYWPEMLNWPLILSRGWLPYRDFTIIHTPILPYTLTLLYLLFGFTPFILHLFGTLLLVISNILTIIFVHSLIRKKWTSLLAGFLFIPLSLAFEGNTVWFELLLTPFLIVICFLQVSYLKDHKLKKILFSGVLMGIVLLIKQTAAFLLPEFLVLLAYLWIQKKYSLVQLIKVASAFIVPIIIFAAIFLGILFHFQILGDFINWAFKFSIILPTLKSSQLSPDVLLPSRRQIIMLAAFALLTGIILVKKRNFTILFLTVWFALSILFIVPRFTYFHLIPMIPFFLAIICLGIESFKNKFKASIILLFPIIAFNLIVLRTTFQVGQRFLNTDVVQISTWLNDNYKDASIFSLNGPDLIYFLTSKPPAVRPWVDQLPWEMEYFGDRYIQAFIKGSPEIIVFHPYLNVPVDGLGAYQPKKVVSYVFSHYQEIKRFPNGVRILKRI